jgi:DNA polymerase-3 subunit beta
MLESHFLPAILWGEVEEKTVDYLGVTQVVHSTKDSGEDNPIVSPGNAQAFPALIHNISTRYPHFIPMKFTCSKSQLDKQLQYISRIITVRQSIPVLSNVLLETDGDIVRMSGTDLELAVTTHIKANIQQEGTFTVPAKIFQEFVHQNPDEEIEISLESYELICKSNKVTARISGIDPEEYPDLPKVEKAKKITVGLREFVDVMKQVVIACAADLSRPVLTGVYAQFLDDKAIFAATDSFRLVERSLAIVPVQEPIQFIIPSRTIQEIIRISATLPETTQLEIELSEQQVLFRMGDVDLYSRLIIGKFPAYQSIIPTTAVAVADITTAEFIQALRMSYVFSQSGITNVLLEVAEDGSMNVASYGSQKGTTKNTLYAVLEEGFTPLKAAFNAKFLLDACQATGAAHLKLRFSGITSPLVVSTEESDYIQLVMPIRLDS